jgi:hypothetical protein
MQDGTIAPLANESTHVNKLEGKMKRTFASRFLSLCLALFLFFPLSSFPSFLLQSSLVWLLSFYLFGDLGGDGPITPCGSATDC